MCLYICNVLYCDVVVGIESNMPCINIFHALACRFFAVGWQGLAFSTSRAVSLAFTCPPIEQVQTGYILVHTSAHVHVNTRRYRSTYL